MQQWPQPVDQQVINHARVLPLDVVSANGSGHAGTAVSLTPFLYTLFQKVLRHDPAAPDWAGRDRFVLSCGHASLALYLQLFLSGYPVEMDDLKATRHFGSLTPGHPEYGHTPGVEATTGPLGQGVGMAVGMAMAERRTRAMLAEAGLPDPELLRHTVYCLASDGDLEEGISHEALAIAGNQRLDNLVVVWDDNNISIEGEVGLVDSTDVAARMAAYGFTVFDLDDPESPQAVLNTLNQARECPQPAFVRLRTRIGYPLPRSGGTPAAHSGAPSREEIAETKLSLGLPGDLPFHFPDDLLAHARQVRDRGQQLHAEWDARLTAALREAPAADELWRRLNARKLPEGWQDRLPVFPVGTSHQTRRASQETLTALATAIPELWGGSADLAETNGVELPGVESLLPDGVVSDYWHGGPGGRLIHFGIREHAMGAILNGIALHGLTRVFGATFFVFSDYLRPAVRLAALMRLPATYVWSHDSIAVGEDGPTHQPVEHLWSYRAIPGLSVVRPADANETLAAWTRIIERPEGPVGICLSRQALPTLPDPAATIAGAQRGGYIVREPEDSPVALIMATGSEVSLALQAAIQLDTEGIPTRVVSLPCLEWFDAEPASYRQEVLPDGIQIRVSVEAGATLGWHRYLAGGHPVGVDRFGASGAGEAVMADCGITQEAIVAAVHAVASQHLCRTS
ncbi:MAG: transketolase [Propionibacteriaceae bacterium]|jgi:transketolase|nr:transketolase [Propionibacteriaceae bacterium]